VVVVVVVVVVVSAASPMARMAQKKSRKGKHQANVADDDGNGKGGDSPVGSDQGDDEEIVGRRFLTLSASNGAAERLNRTLFDIMARPSLIKSKLPTPFWAEAIKTANKVRNRLPTRPPHIFLPHGHTYPATTPVNYMAVYKLKNKM
jgi:hypothetical protein